MAAEDTDFTHGFEIGLQAQSTYVDDVYRKEEVPCRHVLKKCPGTVWPEVKNGGLGLCIPCSKLTSTSRGINTLLTLSERPKFPGRIPHNYVEFFDRFDCYSICVIMCKAHVSLYDLNMCALGCTPISGVRCLNPLIGVMRCILAKARISCCGHPTVSYP